jgi:hypothetical protein
MNGPMQNAVPPPFRSSAAAGWSLGLGIAGLVLCPIAPLFGIPAAICGHVALSRIGKSGGTMKGKGMAVTGLVFGYLSLVVVLFAGLLAAIAMPAFAKAREGAQDRVCAKNMRLLENAKEQYALVHSNEFPRGMDDLVGTYLPAVPRCPQEGVYEIGDSTILPSCSVHGPLRVTADSR